MGLFSKKKSEVAQDTNTNLQKIKDDIEEEIEGLENKIKEKPNALSLKTANGEINFRGVSFKYNNEEREVLKSIN